jgi:multidrug efflux pump subunit AcrA (membrane-fusion protein)
MDAMNRLRSRTLQIALAALVLVAAGGGYWYYRSVYLPGAQTSTEPVQTATVETGSIVLSASGTGTLISSSEWQLGFEGTGTLTELNVSVGDHVQEGDVLAKIDDTSAQQQLQQAQLNLAALTGPEAVASAQQALATAQNDLKSAKYTYSVAQQGNRASKETIAAQEGKVLLAKKALDKARRNFSGGTPNDHDSAQAAIDLNNAQLAYNSAVRTLGWYTGKPTAEDQAQMQAAVDLAQAQVDANQALVDALTGNASAADQNAPVNADLLKLRQAQLDVQTAQTAVDDTVLKAPITGTIVSVNGTVGQPVESSTIITLADLTHPTLQVNFDETDLSQVQVNNPVNVTFDAYPNQTFTGKITQVEPQLVTVEGYQTVQAVVVLDTGSNNGTSPAASAGSSGSATSSRSATTGRSAASTVTTASADPAATATPTNSPQLFLGLNATVQVISAEARNVLLVPIEAVHELAPNSYGVFVMVNGQPQLRVVNVGLESLTSAEITSGLQAGDVVTTGVVQTQSQSSQSQSQP